MFPKFHETINQAPGYFSLSVVEEEGCSERRHYQKSESFRSRDTSVCGVLKFQQSRPKGIKLRTKYG